MIESALSEVVQLGDDGERVIMAAWEAASGYARLMMAVALGDRARPGPADDVLRDAIRLSGSGTQHLRCASILSLAKRTKAVATSDLIVALSQRDGAVKQYAVVALAGVGDARGWNDVLQWFATYRAGRNVEPPSRPALSYLLRHLSERSPSQRAELVRVVRLKWSVLVEDGTARWLLKAWPTVAPGGPAEPDKPSTDQIGGVIWAEHPLFATALFPWTR